MTLVAMRAHITRAAWYRMATGWGAVVILALLSPLLKAPTPTPVLITVLAVIIVVILLCSFGVVHEAEHLARRLGDPYGSLVLTLSIVLIEVVLISAVMLGPGEHTTIARDSVMAVSMIILNAVIGLSLLLGGLKHGGLQHNRQGTSAYLAMAIVLLSLAFALPALIGSGGSYTTGQSVPIMVLALGLYAFFLVRQMGAQARDFTEPALSHGMADRSTKVPPSTAVAGSTAPITAIFQKHRSEILLRFGLLVLTVLPIVLLSHTMAALLDQGLERAGAPSALSGVLIAVIVFLPETITTLRAALTGEGQRVSNLCHGALVSTVGLTIPAVLLIALLTGQTVLLAQTPANLLLLAVSLLLSCVTFASKQTTAIHGAAHLAVFAVYVMVLFS